MHPGARDRPTVTAWLESAPRGVVRVKGFVEALESDTEAWLVQRVGRRAEVTRHDRLPRNAVVVITSPAADPVEVGIWLARLRP